MTRDEAVRKLARLLNDDWALEPPRPDGSSRSEDWGEISMFPNSAGAVCLQIRKWAWGGPDIGIEAGALLLGSLSSLELSRMTSFGYQLRDELFPFIENRLVPTTLWGETTWELWKTIIVTNDKLRASAIFHRNVVLAKT
jgi:hypothetical protein